MQPSGGGSARLGYHDHYVVDGGKARIILSALVTPASIMDNTPLLDLVDWVCVRWNIQPKLAVGDSRYGTVPNIMGLEERGIQAYLATSDFSQRTKYYPAKLFQYDPEKDHYVCPQGQILPLTSRRKTEQVILYCAKAFFFAYLPFSAFDFPTNFDFFNRLQSCANYIHPLPLHINGFTRVQK